MQYVRDLRIRRGLSRGQPPIPGILPNVYKQDAETRAAVVT
jgi:hypothetical protein